MDHICHYFNNIIHFNFSGGNPGNTGTRGRTTLHNCSIDGELLRNLNAPRAYLKRSLLAKQFLNSIMGSVGGWIARGLQIKISLKKLIQVDHESGGGISEQQCLHREEVRDCSCESAWETRRSVWGHVAGWCHGKITEPKVNSTVIFSHLIGAEWFFIPGLPKPRRWHRTRGKNIHAGSRAHSTRRHVSSVVTDRRGGGCLPPYDHAASAFQP